MRPIWWPSLHEPLASTTYGNNLDVVLETFVYDHVEKEPPNEGIYKEEPIRKLNQVMNFVTVDRLTTICIV